MDIAAAKELLYNEGAKTIEVSVQNNHLGYQEGGVSEDEIKEKASRLLANEAAAGMARNQFMNIINNPYDGEGAEIKKKYYPGWTRDNFISLYKLVYGEAENVVAKNVNVRVAGFDDYEPDHSEDPVSWTKKYQPETYNALMKMPDPISRKAAFEAVAKVLWEKENPREDIAHDQNESLRLDNEQIERDLRDAENGTGSWRPLEQL
jgi:hypothetical protein